MARIVENPRTHLGNIDQRPGDSAVLATVGDFKELAHFCSIQVNFQMFAVFEGFRDTNDYTAEKTELYIGRRWARLSEYPMSTALR